MQVSTRQRLARTAREMRRDELVAAYDAARARLRRERTVEAAAAAAHWLARLVVYDEEQEASA
jgi:hypothetical protein